MSAPNEHPDDWDYQIVEVLKVVDGDTLDVRLQTVCEIDIGFRICQSVVMTTVQRLRLLGVDTPERNKPGFAEATSYSKGWVAAKLAAEALRARTERQDAFGRWLADVYDGRTGESLGAALIRDGFAVPYRAS